MDARAQIAGFGVAHHQEGHHRKAEQHAEEHDLERRIAAAEVFDDRVMGGEDAEGRKASRTPRWLGSRGQRVRERSSSCLPGTLAQGCPGHRSPLRFLRRSRVARCTCVRPHRRGRSWCGPDPVVSAIHQIAPAPNSRVSPSPASTRTRPDRQMPICSCGEGVLRAAPAPRGA
jgi:hypothetical protein